MTTFRLLAMCVAFIVTLNSNAQFAQGIAKQAVKSAIKSSVKKEAKAAVKQEIKIATKNSIKKELKDVAKKEAVAVVKTDVRAASKNAAKEMAEKASETAIKKGVKTEVKNALGKTASQSMKTAEKDVAKGTLTKETASTLSHVSVDKVVTKNKKVTFKDLAEQRATNNIKQKAGVTSEIKENGVKKSASHLSVENASKVFDDKGKPIFQNGIRIPNNKYELNGYQYTTDNQGRIAKVEGRITIPQDKVPRRPNLPEIKDAKTTDDKGHMVAHEFGGADNEGNLVPMNAELNRHGDYRKWERKIGQAARNGKNVDVTIECEYGENARPVSFFVTTNIDGEITERTFLNQ